MPGIRENGGQYTHAATWVVLAAALQGRGDRALELWNLLNPIRHAATPAEVEHYKVEPYVVCADVYGAPPHTGRGGWTWYTGSAGWLYRVGLEAILGFRLRRRPLRARALHPARLAGITRSPTATVRDLPIRVENPAGAGRGVRSRSWWMGSRMPDGVVAARRRASSMTSGLRWVVTRRGEAMATRAKPCRKT